MRDPSPLESRSVGELVAACEAGADPEYVFFWGHQPRHEGRLDESCLSQWWPCRFEVEGEVFDSAEHYMMWRKATLFGDGEAARAVLDAGSPAQAKSLGRAVRGFDGATWERHRWDIVVAGSVAKFGTDPVLRDYLLSTRDRVLVEASPVDAIWGIGLAADDPEANNPAQWRGSNLLGFALMEARLQVDPNRR